MCLTVSLSLVRYDKKLVGNIRFEASGGGVGADKT